MCGSKNSTQTKTVNYPPEVTSAVNQALGQATTAAATPYQPYPGQLVAPLNQIQGAGIAGIGSTVGTAQPYLNQALGNINNISPVTPTQFSGAQVGQYESPYTQDVINATQQQFNLQNAQQQQALTGNAASQHALGGDRVGVAQAQLAGQQQTAQAPVIAGLQNQNYAQALNEFNTQQQTGMAAQEANNYTNLYGAGELGNLGQLQLGTGLQGYGALLQAGGLGQQTQQAQDTAAQQQFLAQQQYPFQTAQYLSGIAGGLGGLYSGDTTTTTTQPSNIFGQIAGLGLSAAGLGAFGSGGLFSGLGSIFGSTPSAPYGGAYGTKRGGAIDGYADGGSDDDAPPDDDEESASPDYGADDQDAYSPTSGFEGASSQMAENSLAGIASGEDADTADMGGADMSGASPMGGAGLMSQQGSLGLDPRHMAMLQAGLGMMASKNPSFLGTVGEGGMSGLKAYEQERLMEGQMGYRQAMSQAATMRSEALAQRVYDAEHRPTFNTATDTGKWVFPDGHIQDTGIPTSAFTRNQNQAQAQQATADYRKKLLDRPDYMITGTDPSDSSKVVLTNKYNPKDTISVAAAPRATGSQGVTMALVGQLMKDNPSMSTQDALSAIKDPSGQHAAAINASTERLAQSAARADPAFQDDPVAAVNKWRSFYKTGIGGNAPAANPGGGHANNNPANPAPKQYMVGKAYVDSKGNWARFNQDGTFTSIPKPAAGQAQ